MLHALNANYRIHDLEERVRATVATYGDNLAQARASATLRGARFAHFLQPNLYSLARRGEYVERLLSYGFVPTQAEEAFTATYPHFAALVGVAAARGAAAFDLRSSFDSVSEPVYLDGWHINHRGNARVAEATFWKLFSARRERRTQSGARLDDSTVAGRMHVR